MKRSKSSSKAMRQRTTAEKHSSRGNSSYAQKSRINNQMYGPGCCGNNTRTVAT